MERPYTLLFGVREFYTSEISVSLVFCRLFWNLVVVSWFPRNFNIYEFTISCAVLVNRCAGEESSYSAQIMQSIAKWSMVSFCINIKWCRRDHYNCLEVLTIDFGCCLQHAYFPGREFRNALELYAKYKSKRVDFVGHVNVRCWYKYDVVVEYYFWCRFYVLPNARRSSGQVLLGMRF